MSVEHSYRDVKCDARSPSEKIWIAIILTTYYIVNAFLFKDLQVIVLTGMTLSLLLLIVLKIDKKFLSIHDVMVFMLYVFYVIRPLQGFANQTFQDESPAGNASFSGQTIHLAFMSIWLQILLYIIFINHLFHAHNKSKMPNVTTSKPQLLLILAFSITTYTCYILSSGGLANSFVGRYDKLPVDEAPWTSIFFGLQMGCTILAAAHLFGFNRSAKLRNSEIALIVPVLILEFLACNPLNTARFMLICVYVPILFMIVRGRIKFLTFMILAIIFAIVAMPILNSTTRTGELYSDSSINESSLTIPYNDVFDMVLANINYTETFGNTYGEKTIGILFFFVPRSIWINKPTIAGFDVGNDMLRYKFAGTSNLSSPIICDGYRDYGLFGSIITSSILIIFINFFGFRNGKNLNGHPVLEYSLMASLPIIMRGPTNSIIAIPFFELLMIYLALNYNTLVTNQTKSPEVRINAT